MSEHSKRADLRAKNSDPINYTCGKCKQVYAFEKDNPYKCPVCDENERKKTTTLKGR